MGHLKMVAQDMLPNSYYMIPARGPKTMFSVCLRDVLILMAIFRRKNLNVFSYRLMLLVFFVLGGGPGLSFANF